MPSRCSSATSAKADGRWRLYAFAGANDIAATRTPACARCAGSSRTRRDSPVRRYTRRRPGHRRRVRPARHLPAGPPRAGPRVDARAAAAAQGPLRAGDYEKVFCPDLKNGQDIFDLRGIDRAQGALVVVRPDQYVAHVLPLDAHEALAEFFAGFMLAQD